MAELDFSHAVGPYDPAPPRFPDAAFAPAISAATIALQRGAQAEHARALNAALAAHPDWLGLTIETVLRRGPQAPEPLATALREDGGGHANHQFFWKILRPPGDGAPDGELAAAITTSFGGLDALKRRFRAAALSRVGSGWAFVVARPDEGFRLDIVVLPDNGSVLSLPRPSLGLFLCDLWEHAYALDHGLARGAWIDAFWRCLDWAVVAERLRIFQAGRNQA